MSVLLEPNHVFTSESMAGSTTSFGTAGMETMARPGVRALSEFCSVAPRCRDPQYPSSILIRRQLQRSCSRKASRDIARTFNVHEATIYRLAREELQNRLQ
jgi:hypothetical protein